MIIECPLNGQFHNRRDVIIMSRMAVSNNFLYPDTQADTVIESYANDKDQLGPGYLHLTHFFY